MRYIGLDVGTSSCKASVMDGKGHIFASSAYSYPLIYTNEGFVEISPDAIWQSSTRALKDIAMKSRDAKALAVSSLGETMVILGANDRPVTNGIVYLDQRCKRELSEIITRINPRDLYAKTLVPLNQMFSLCKILWYQKNAPWILRDGKKIFLVSDYINYMLSGNRAIDPSMASRTMFFDANELKWSKEIADLFDLPIDKFSEIAKAGTYIGT
ncbi:MAG TPA: FGGY family carbohydrate kinase, partial [Flexilinea sp.]|nr:FGGY family carbohydrate kinase [Flexilinea sp.]